MKQKPVVAEYEILEIPHIIDGDTLWVQRRRVIGDVEGMSLITEDYAGGIDVRLDDGGRGVNTPEKRKDLLGWGMAKEDLEALCQTFWVRGGPNPILRVYELHGVFGRTLADIIAPVGSVTAFQRDINGWEPYR